MIKGDAQVVSWWAAGGMGGDTSIGEGDRGLDQTRALDRFLASVERSAFRIARYGVRNTDDALDIVQEAMMQLVKRYSSRPEQEWKPLFYRILENKVRDYQRRSTVRNRVMAWFGSSSFDEDGESFVERAADTQQPQPPRQAELDHAVSQLDKAVYDLPTRQQEAFLLRTLEGLDVAQTAKAMGCSEGSVKTHYSRALKALRARLGEHWS